MASRSAGWRDISTSTARMVPACSDVCRLITCPSCSRSPRSVPVFGWTAIWRQPSINAAKTNSAFDGQRRYTVALLAWAAAATASTVKRSYPCSCSSCSVTVSNSVSRGDQGEHSAPPGTVPVTAPNPRASWSVLSSTVPLGTCPLRSVTEVADTVPVDQRPAQRRVASDDHAAEVRQRMAGRQAVLRVLPVHQRPVNGRLGVREGHRLFVAAVVDLLDGGGEPIVELFTADRPGDRVLHVAVEPVRRGDQVGQVGPLRSRVVVAARLDFAQTGQDLDGLAERMGQRLSGLLGTDHVRGVDGIEIVAGELVRELFGLAFALLTQARSGESGVMSGWG